MGRNADLYMYITAVSNTDHNRIQFKAKLTLGQKKSYLDIFQKFAGMSWVILSQTSLLYPSRSSEHPLVKLKAFYHKYAPGYLYLLRYVKSIFKCFSNI